jgi:hypothetical protein
MAGMISLVTSPRSPVSSSMTENAVEMRSGVSTTIVTTGTWRPSCSRRSPCGGWSPWKPQMPRWVVAPLTVGGRDQGQAPRYDVLTRTSAARNRFGIGWPAWLF